MSGATKMVSQRGFEKPPVTGRIDEEGRQKPVWWEEGWRWVWTAVGACCLPCFSHRPMTLNFYFLNRIFFFFLDGFYSLFCTKSSKSDGHFTHPVWTSHTVQLALTRAPSSASQALTAFLLPHRFRPAVVVNKCLKATHFVQSLKQ